MRPLPLERVNVVEREGWGTVIVSFVHGLLNMDMSIKVGKICNSGKIVDQAPTALLQKGSIWNVVLKKENPKYPGV